MTFMYRVHVFFSLSLSGVISLLITYSLYPTAGIPSKIAVCRASELPLRAPKKMDPYPGAPSQAFLDSWGLLSSSLWTSQEEEGQRRASCHLSQPREVDSKISCWWFRNPVNSPVDMVNIPLFTTGFIHARWDFFHQHYLQNAWTKLKVAEVSWKDLTSKGQMKQT